MLNRKVPLYAAIAAWGIGAVGGFLAMSAMDHGSGKSTGGIPVRTNPKGTESATCEYRIRRVEGFGLVKPVLSAEPICEAPQFTNLKGLVSAVVADAQSKGIITEASVYVREFRKGEWMTVNGHLRFDPGSLLKVPIMLTMLKMAEEDPKVFSTPWKLTDVPPLPQPAFPPSKAIAIGQPYTLPQLIEYSIQRSDNLANTLMIQHMDFAQFRRMLIEVGLPDMANGDQSYPLSTPDYAMFFKAIYNTTFLSPRTSDFAMHQLVNCEFKDGLRAGIPKEVEVAHKFGESGPDELRQFHEAGMVYAGDTPYLIVVMTRGKDIKALPGFVAGISSIVYKSMTGKPVAI